MTAAIPRTESRTWRAVLAGREVLKLGLIKRVGSGETISIWNDSWIPTSATMRPMGRLKDMDVTTVNELMIYYQWNVPLIHSLFFAPESRC